MGAPLNPVPSTVKVFLEGFVDNDDVYKWGNVLHFEYAGGAPSNANCVTLANGIENQWADHVASLCPAPTKLTRVNVTDLTSDSAGEGEWLGTELGTRGDDSIPANAAVLISYPSSTRYKGGHPRQYLYVGGNADFEGAAHWSDLFTAEAESKWQLFLTGCIALTAGTTTLTSFGFVRYHGKYLPNGGAPHYYLDNPFFTPVSPTGAVASKEIASQRRRVGRRRA